ncbi:hypothetical protein [Shimia ponticola]|uniref:hypothetical protein n=1 Tax=Shimia ponticola TaxID=2582893 RepID=UPI0011BEAB43|nr:hypothetical protein [Shimia ponticola]
MKRVLILCLLAGCAQIPATDAVDESATQDRAEASVQNGDTPTRPRLRPDAGDAAAAQPAQDAATEAEEGGSEQASAPIAGSAAPRQSATTLVSLGDVTEPGLWIKTPLVDVTGQGQARSASTGRTATVTLIPIQGPRTAGSRASLQAMQALGLSLTDIAEVEVSAL